MPALQTSVAHETTLIRHSGEKYVLLDDREEPPEPLYGYALRHNRGVARENQATGSGPRPTAQHHRLKTAPSDAHHMNTNTGSAQHKNRAQKARKWASRRLRNSLQRGTNPTHTHPTPATKALSGASAAKTFPKNTPIDRKTH